MFDITERGGTVQRMATIPEFIWELTFGIYLIVKGFKSPPSSAEDAERTATAETSSKSTAVPRLAEIAHVEETIGWPSQCHSPEHPTESFTEFPRPGGLVLSGRSGQTGSSMT